MDVSRRVWVGALLFAAVCVYTVSVSPESTLFLTSVLLPPQPCRLSIFTFLAFWNFAWNFAQHSGTHDSRHPTARPRAHMRNGT